MKLIALASALALTAAACGGGAGPQTAATTAPRATTAAPSPTPATTIVFTAALRSTEEVPPITSAEASCTGTGTFTIDRTANTAKFEAQVSGCPAGTAPTIMHIHRGARGANGGVVVNSGLAAGEWTLTAGAGSITKNVATVDPAVAAEIIANPAGFYYNLHSQANPGGVVRGQLERRP